MTMSGSSPTPRLPWLKRWPMDKSPDRRRDAAARRLGFGLGSRCPIAVGCLCGLLAGCHHGPVKRPATGQGSFSFIEPPPPASPETADVTMSEEMARYRPPVMLNDLARPIYPSAALAAQDRKSVV